MWRGRWADQRQGGVGCSRRGWLGEAAVQQHVCGVFDGCRAVGLAALACGNMCSGRGTWVKRPFSSAPQCVPVRTCATADRWLRCWTSR